MNELVEERSHPPASGEDRAGPRPQRRRGDAPEAARAAALAQITGAITASLDVARIFRIVAQQAEHILAHDALTVLLLTPAQEEAAGHALEVAFCQPPLVETGRAWPVNSFSFGPHLLANQPVVADFRATANRHPGDQLFLTEIGWAGLMVPIQAGPHVLGGLILSSHRAAPYQPADAHLVAPVANLLALALEHHRLDQQARALAVVEERNRLAREIHDTLAQSLTGIILNLEALKPYALGRSATDEEVLAETEALARSALAEARRSILGLQPTPLTQHPLRDALATELAGLAKRTGVANQFYVQGRERAVPPDVALALFRVAQEALQNVAKHAAAAQVLLGLAFEPEAVVLTVEDDGVGFVPAAATPAAGGGFGLMSMAARTQSLGGVFAVASHPGHGTTIRVALPTTHPKIATAAVVVQGDPPLTPAGEACPTRVLLVDDHPLVRQGIRRILEGQPDMQVVGEAEDGLAAIAQTSRLRPDVVLLDLQLPRLSGVESLPRLRAAHPPVEVVILTIFDQDEQVFASLKAGARGYVLKDADPTTILAAIRAARQGQAALPPTIATRVMERFRVLAKREEDPAALTGREVDILAGMAEGQSYKEIAARLQISAKTVQYHVTHILRKLDVHSRGEAVAAARERGLLRRRP